MKYLFIITFSILCLQLNAQIFQEAAKAIPTKGLISCVYTIEIYNTIGGEEDLIRKKRTISRAKSVLSIADERMLISFSPLESRIVDNDRKEINRSRQEVTYIFDGRNWLQYGYQTTYTKDQKTIPDEYFKISNDVPGAIHTLVDVYAGKVFLLDQFKFFEARDEYFTVKEILLNKSKYPGFKVTEIENDIQIKLETTTNIYTARVSPEPFFPHIKHYQEIYKPYNNLSQLTTDYKFADKISLLNTPLSVPQKLDRIYFNEGDNGGFVMSITLESIEFLADKDFEDFIPEVPVGWQVIDEPKGITYKKADTKEGILKTIRNL